MRQTAQRRPRRKRVVTRTGPPLVRAEPRAPHGGRASLPVPLLGGVAAAVGAGLTMGLLRWTLQVRTVPERLLEWALLLVSPGLVEASLQRFGFDAKRYALAAAIAATLAVLAGLGAFVLGRGWSGRQLLGLGVGLWLVVMVGVMPLTGAGWFARELIDGSGSAILGYLAVALVYAGCLLIARTGVRSAPEPLGASASRATRRTAIIGIGSALAALVTTYLIQFVTLREDLTEVRVLDPQEPVPSSGIDPPGTHPNSVAPLTADAPTSSPAPPTAVAQVVASEPTFPEPLPAPPMKRDKNGAILPAGRRPGEFTDLITTNDDFYVVTKNAGGDPQVQARSWRLRVDGEVNRPIELDYTSLRKLSADEVVCTLECISNFAARCELAPFGCDLISTAHWKGVRVSTILELAGGVKPNTPSIAVIAADEYTSALPVDVLMDPGALLVYEMNGAVLPREHGYPARLLVPGRYGMKSAKWVVGLRPIMREFVDWYGQRNWSKDGIVKTISRIDLPQHDADLPPGEYNIAGIAYGGARGVSHVEFSTDGGLTWHMADFVEPPIGRHAWVRWIGRFALEPGAQKKLVSRASDGTGELQTEPFSLPEPDGSSGWPSLVVRARST